MCYLDVSVDLMFVLYLLKLVCDSYDVVVIVMLSLLSFE